MHAFPFQGHEVWCDLRDVANPERDRRLQAHLGFHPLNIQNLMVNETFMNKLFHAMREALENRVSKIRFICQSGRHRSVAAAYLAHLILAGIVGNDRIAVRHASNGHWHNICNMQCNQCWNFVHNPPVEFHRALAEIRHDLQQQCQPYMLAACDACRLLTCKLSWVVSCLHTCNSKTSFAKQPCVTGHKDSGVDDPASRAPCAGAGNDRHRQYDFLFVKNQQNQQIYQNTTIQAIDVDTNFGIVSFMQLPRHVPGLNNGKRNGESMYPVLLGAEVPRAHELVNQILDFGSPLQNAVIIVDDLNVMIHPDNCSLRPPTSSLPKYFPLGKERQRDTGDSLSGTIQQRQDAEAGSQISATFLIVLQALLQGGHSDSDDRQFRDQPPSNLNSMYDRSPEPIQCFGDDGILHDDPIQSYDDDDLCENYQPSCPPTVLDESESQASQDHKCSHVGEAANLPSFNRKRSAQQAFADEISQELQVALQYEYAPSSSH